MSLPAQTPGPPCISTHTQQHTTTHACARKPSPSPEPKQKHGLSSTWTKDHPGRNHRPADGPPNSEPEPPLLELRLPQISLLAPPPHRRTGFTHPGLSSQGLPRDLPWGSCSASQCWGPCTSKLRFWARRPHLNSEVRG